MNADSYAWLVDVERAAEVRRFVVVGASVVEAAQHAQEAIASSEGAGSRLIGIELLAPALVDIAAPTEASARRPAPTQLDPVPAGRAGSSRAEQLVSFLQQRGGRAHLRGIAEALSTSTANAQNVIAAAVKKGLVERAGQRTGLVVLAKASEESAPAPPPSLAGLSRAEQVSEVLRRNNGEAHVSVIAEELDTSVLNARNCTAAAVKSGLVHRVGRRSGRVRLVKAALAEVVPEAITPRTPKPAELTGILRRVYTAMVRLDAPATAKEIAAVLGCRPREAGNAAVLLTDSGLVVRSDRHQSPRRWLVRRRNGRTD